MSSELRPGPEGFTQQQTDWLEHFYLLLPDVTALTSLRAALPPTKGLPHRETLDGRLVIGAYLLTDCLQPGDNWIEIASQLAHFPLIQLLPNSFPSVEMEL